MNTCSPPDSSLDAEATPWPGRLAKAIARRVVLLPFVLGIVLSLPLDLTGQATSAETGTEVEVAAPAQPAPVLSTNAEEVVRLAQGGIEESVLLAFVESSRQPFLLNPDQIVYLKDLGIPDTVVAAMIRQDKLLQENREPVAAPPVITNAPPNSATTVTNPPAPVYVTNAPTEVQYFYDSLSPYGTWVYLDGVGWSWQPSVVVVNNTWQPYWNGGNWIYSDYGWYWRSDYSWGWAPFHYGRWHRHHHLHWVWVPGTVWGPAWVTWRYTDAYCGWAPLPYGSHFVHGHGWYHNGVSVGLHFDFGLPYHHYHYVETRHLHDRHLHKHGIAAPRAREIHGTTTVNNNQARGSDNRIINPGIPPERVARATGQPVPQARIEVEQPASDRVVRRPERVERVGGNLVVRRPELTAPAQLQTSLPTAQKVDDRTPIVRPLPNRGQVRGVPARPPGTGTGSGTASGAPATVPGAQVSRPSAPSQTLPRTQPGDARTLPNRPTSPAITPPPRTVPRQTPAPSQPVPAPAQPTPVRPPGSVAPPPGSRGAPARIMPPASVAPMPGPTVPRAPMAESPRGHQQNPAYVRPAVPPSQPAMPRSLPPASSGPPPRQAPTR